MFAALIGVIMFIITLSMKTVMLGMKTTMMLTEKVLEKKAKAGKFTNVVNKVKARVSGGKKKPNKGRQAKQQLVAMKAARVAFEMSMKAMISLVNGIGTVLGWLGALIDSVISIYAVLVVLAACAVILVIFVLTKDGGVIQTMMSTQAQSGYVSSAGGEVAVTGDNSTWFASCTSMWQWYCSNVNTYQHRINHCSSGNDGTLECNGNPACSGGSNGKGYYRHGTSCSLLGGELAMDDCSAYVGACLRYHGVINSGHNGLGSSAFKPGESLSQNPSFTSKFKMYYPSDYGSTYTPQVGDIMVQNGHVEIFAGEIDGHGTSYSWGSVPECVRKGTGCQAVNRADMSTYVNRLYSNGGEIVCIWQYVGG